MVKIVVIGLIGTVLALVVRQYKPELGMVVSIASGVAVLGMLFSELTGVIEALGSIASKFSIDNSLFITALKITGVAYIGEFGVQACKDAGEGAIASKVELGAKVIILAMCIPLVLDILTLFSTIIP